MKRFYLVLAAVAMLGVAACEKQNPGTDPKQPEGGEVNPQPQPQPQPEPEAALSPEAQQDKLIATAEALMDALDLDNWKADADWTLQTVQELADFNGRADADLEKWAKAVEEAMYEYTEGTDWRLTKTTVDLSKVTGHFTENNGVFHREPANNLSIDITLNGEPVHAEFNANGYYDPMLFYVSEREYNSYNEYGYVDGTYTNSHEVWVAVPKEAELKITRSGKDFAVLKAQFSLTDVNADGTMDPLNDKIGVKVSLAAAGYELAVNKLDYTPSNGAVDVTFTKGTQTILALNAKAAYQFGQEMNFTPKSADVAIDLMGMTQVKGTVASFDKLMEAYAKVNEALKGGDEATIDAAFAELEKCFDLGVYYDGGTLKQATVGFDYVAPEDGHNYVAVLIRFADGSAMAVDDFVSSDKFAGLVEEFETWLYKISNHFSRQK